MYVLVINQSGNVGKTTIADNVFAPRLKDVRRIRFSVLEPTFTLPEDISVIGSKSYLNIIMGMVAADNVIIDISDKCTEAFMSLVNRSTGILDEFDLIVVPTLADPKIMFDTIGTIEFLARHNVPKEKVKLVFNQADSDDGFDILENHYSEHQTFTWNPAAALPETAFLKHAIGSTNGPTINDLATDKTNFHELLKNESDKAKRTELARKIIVAQKAKNIVKKFDSLYVELIS